MRSKAWLVAGFVVMALVGVADAMAACWWWRRWRGTWPKPFTGANRPPTRDQRAGISPLRRWWMVRQSIREVRKLSRR